jgi:hypothetical protein
MPICIRSQHTSFNKPLIQTYALTLGCNISLSPWKVLTETKQEAMKMQNSITYYSTGACGVVSKYAGTNVSISSDFGPFFYSHPILLNLEIFSEFEILLAAVQILHRLILKLT